MSLYDRDNPQHLAYASLWESAALRMKEREQRERELLERAGLPEGEAAQIARAA